MNNEAERKTIIKLLTKSISVLEDDYCFYWGQDKHKTAVLRAEISNQKAALKWIDSSD